MKKLLSIALGALLLTLFSMPTTAQASFWDRFRHKDKSSRTEEQHRTRTSDQGTSATQEGTMPGQSGRQGTYGGSSSAPQSSGQSQSGGSSQY
jgi:hypothetical protein